MASSRSSSAAFTVFSQSACHCVFGSAASTSAGPRRIGSMKPMTVARRITPGTICVLFEVPAICYMKISIRPLLLFHLRLVNQRKVHHQVCLGAIRDLVGLKCLIQIILHRLHCHSAVHSKQGNEIVDQKLFGELAIHVPFCV